MIQENLNKPKSLYLHVPFCKTICYYCDFCHSVYSRKQALLWLETVKKEITLKNINTCLDTIYIGGGTPSSLDDDLVDSLLGLLDPYARFVKEYTIEVNPETMTKEKVSILKKHGINRISMGLQSSDKSLLKLMNRHHDLEDVKRVMSLFYEQDITNISLDLMYSLPTQTLEILKKSIEDTIALKPSHISIYSLTIEENSVFGKKGYQSLDDDLEADMYEFACLELEKHGYKQYEISNFCLEGKESRHNLAYWHYLDFYGISLGASGKENGIRYDNTTIFKEYYDNPLKRNETILPKDDQIFENIMMSLRLKQGINIREFNKKYDISLVELYQKPIYDHIEQGNLMIEDDYLKCTEKGYPILNTILCDFL